MRVVTMPSRHHSLTMLTQNLFIFVLLVCGVCQHAVDGRYVGADDFTTLVAEVAAIKEERLDLNNRINELEAKVSIGEAKLAAVEDKLSVTETKLAAVEDKLLVTETKLAAVEDKLIVTETKLAAVEDKFSVTETKLAGTEEKLRIVEDKLDKALSRIDELEKHSENCRDQAGEASNKVGNGDIGHGTDREFNITTTANKKGKDVIRERTAAGTGQAPSYRIVRTAEQQIAFSVYLETALTGLGKQHPIKFDGVQLNAGNAYDAIIGIFICPVSGVYMFQSALMAARTDYIETEIVKDGSTLVTMMASASTAGYGYDQGFNSVITTCNQGEHVWVREFSGYGTTVLGTKFSSFSGYLIWEI